MREQGDKWKLGWPFNPLADGSVVSFFFFLFCKNAVLCDWLGSISGSENQEESFIFLYSMNILSGCGNPMPCGLMLFRLGQVKLVSESHIWRKEQKTLDLHSLVINLPNNTVESVRNIYADAY